MQGPTHLLVGMLIARLAEPNPHWSARVAVATAGVLSHGLLDRLARATYHPSEPLLNNWFWWSYHTLLWGACGLLILRYGRRYWLGMSAALLPDLDWLLVAVGVPKVGDEPLLHTLAYQAVEPLLSHEAAQRLPNLGLAPIGALNEIVLCVLLGLCFTQLRQKNREQHGEIHTRLMNG